MRTLQAKEASLLTGGRKSCRELAMGAYGASLDGNDRRQARFERRGARRNCPVFTFPFRPPSK